MNVNALNLIFIVNFTQFIAFWDERGTSRGTSDYERANKRYQQIRKRERQRLKWPLTSHPFNVQRFGQKLLIDISCSFHHFNSNLNISIDNHFSWTIWLRRTWFWPEFICNHVHIFKKHHSNELECYGCRCANKPI